MLVRQPPPKTDDDRALGHGLGNQFLTQAFQRGKRLVLLRVLDDDHVMLDVVRSKDRRDLRNVKIVQNLVGDEEDLVEGGLVDQGRQLVDDIVAEVVGRIRNQVGFEIDHLFGFELIHMRTSLCVTVSATSVESESGSAQLRTLCFG